MSLSIIMHQCASPYIMYITLYNIISPYITYITPSIDLSPRSVGSFNWLLPDLVSLVSAGVPNLNYATHVYVICHWYT